jgi:Domain of unknown function (DUF4783)
MKRLYILAASVILLSAFSLLSNLDNVVSAIKNGNAVQMAKYFDDNVDIAMPDKSNSYTKNEAQVVLKNFFNANSVKGFDVIHKGSNAGSEYCIGTLQTAKGAFRTTIFMKQKNGTEVLQELKFESN